MLTNSYVNNQQSNVKKPYQCLDCDWSFSTAYKLNRHIKSHTGVKPFICDVCNKGFSNSYNLTVHQKIHLRYICSEASCLKTFKSNVSLLEHTQKEHSANSFKCLKKRCKGVFNTKEELVLHLANHVSEIICTECGKIFQKPYLLKQHFLTHTGDSKFKCGYNGCNKAFANKTRLKRHELIHLDKREFVCDFEGCDMKFNYFQYLKAHKRTHEYSKHFKCSELNCHKSFSCAWTLKVHMLKHAGQRPYQCEFQNCNKSYLTLSNLKVHQKTHNMTKNKKSSDCSLTLNKFKTFLSKDFTGTLPSRNVLINEEFSSAAFGEFICNEYTESSATYATSSEESQMDIFSGSREQNIVADVNGHCNSINCHDYILKESEKQSLLLDDHESVIFGIWEQKDDYIDVGNLVEMPMELSSGNIFNENLNVSLCVPDHVYSHRNIVGSTVNLEDIRP
ncbi:zinc finger protein 567 [Hydra vulgaris]|uniref:zinc finger protein 567 n=1 Tax=Hydra vulgaris TaxID=6087 RepID=UPI0002B4A266|nr:zinc finger protein 567 [Hydra vulgaris]